MFWSPTLLKGVSNPIPHHPLIKLHHIKSSEKHQNNPIIFISNKISHKQSLCLLHAINNHITNIYTDSWLVKDYAINNLIGSSQYNVVSYFFRYKNVKNISKDNQSDDWWCNFEPITRLDYPCLRERPCHMIWYSYSLSKQIK